MGRYALTVSYDGTDFIGWQKQPEGRSVQVELEKALSTLLRAPIALTGSGRTDAGVHARGQVAHADFELIGWNLDDLKFRLNSFLPAELSVLAIEGVAQDFHARFSAKSRMYKYFCTLQKDPFSSKFCARLPFRALDIAGMNKAADYFIGEHNFRSFAKSVPEELHYKCTVRHAAWEECPALPYPGLGLDGFAFTIEANRFLRGQVRALVGALLEVGTGRQQPEWVREVLEAQRDQVSARLAPAQGLHLWQVQY